MVPEWGRSHRDWEPRPGRLFQSPYFRPDPEGRERLVKHGKGPHQGAGPKNTHDQLGPPAPVPAPAGHDPGVPARKTGGVKAVQAPQPCGA
ncbi:hypothetical protein GCM10009636_26730 [Arthrobacter koreensis]